jgi:hypothetical protein
MMTLEQAREILDTISRQARMTRDEHSLAGQAIEVLYDGAKENQESRQTTNVVPFPAKKE